MKVVIIKSTNKVGMVGDVKNVADGYAMNFLIPNKIALPATVKNIEQAKLLQKQKQQSKNVSTAEKGVLEKKIVGVTLTFKEKTDEKNTFFAGINKDKISRKLKEAGFSINSKKIELEQPIKSPGEYLVAINLDAGKKVKIKIITQKK